MQGYGGHRALNTFTLSFKLNIQILLVGTKSDLRGQLDKKENPEEKDVTQKEGDQMAKDIKAISYMETSSKTGEGIKELFEEAIRAAMDGGKKGDGGCCLIL